MDKRLTLTLHLDAFNMAMGGGFTEYTNDGRKRVAMVWPAFPGGERSAEDALRWMLEQYLLLYGHQLRLVEDTPT